MSTVALYAPFFGLLFFGLTIKTVLRRRTLATALGDAGDAQLRRAIRAHANFAEYAPLGLFLIYLCEQKSAPAILIHSICILFFVGRLSHAYGISQVNENFKFRVFGMMMTFLTLISTSFYLILQNFSAL